MAQFHAAYLLEPVQQILTEGAMAEQALALIRQLGVYERDSKDSRPLIEANQLAAVASNIISRAIPTRPSPWMQQVLLSAYANKPNWSAWVKTDNPDKELLREQLFNALHIIDPRITQESQAQDFQSDWDRFGEEHAEEFLYHLVPAFLGSPFLQLLERDVPIQEFLHYAPQPQKGLNKYLHGKPAGQIDSDVLFSMQFPYALDNSQGLIFEVRDIRKEALEQRHIDGLRDEALSLAGYSAVYRYRTTDFANIKHKFKELKPLTDSDYFIRISNNFNTPLYQSPDGLAAMELVLLPVLAARIQKTLLEFVHKGLLSLEDDTWHIGVIERDLPAALLATEDLRQLLAHLMRLKGGGQHMPTIKLSVFHTAEFKDTPVTEKLHHTATEIQHKRLGISQFSEFTRFDLLLDVSILMRRSVKVPAYKHNAKLFATI